MDQYLPILLLVVLSLLFAVGSFVASRMLAPNGRLNPAKVGPLRVRDRPQSASPPPASRCGSTWWR